MYPLSHVKFGNKKTALSHHLINSCKRVEIYK